MPPSEEEAELIAETDAIEAAIQLAVRDALIQHKRLGNPVVSWENGQVVWIPPEQINVDDLPKTPRKS